MTASRRRESPGAARLLSGGLRRGAVGPLGPLAEPPNPRDGNSNPLESSPRDAI